MATIKQIQFKRSKVAGVKPKPADLAEGELALNIKDRTIFTKDGDGAIVDLGFAKGGQVDGTINHTGNYNQTGNYAVTGTITQNNGNFDQTNGNIGTTGTITANGNIRSNSEINGPTVISRNGSFRSRAPGNVHFWFEGQSTAELAAAGGADWLERGVLYSEAMSANGGSIRLRVQNGHAAGHTNTLYTFGGNGTFDAPVVTTNTVDHYKKPIGSYDSQSLITWDYDTNNVNRLRKFRGAGSGAIWHEQIDYTFGKSALTYYTGVNPDDRIMTLGNDGSMVLQKSLMVGAYSQASGGSFSVLPNAYSLAIGDNDTGFGWIRDGSLGQYANGALVSHTNSGTLYSDKQLSAQYTSGASESAIMPPDQVAMIRVVTSVDGNDVSGPGDTHIGYASGGKLHHYFRGKGTMNIDTKDGMLVRYRSQFLGDLYGPSQVATLGQVLLQNNNHPNGTTRLATWHASGADIKSYRFEIYNTVGTGSTKTRVNIMTTDIANVDLPANNFNQKTTFVGDLGWGGETLSQIRMDAGSQVGSNVMRFVANNSYGNRGAIFRRSEGNFYIIPTPETGDPMTTDIGSLRPFQIDLASGMVGISNGITLRGDYGGKTAIPLTINGNSIGGGDVVINSGASPQGGILINSTYSHSYNDVSSTNGGGVVINHGNSGTGGGYYPAIKSMRYATGYRMTFEFGQIAGGNNAWGQGVIRIRGDNPTGQQSRWNFTMDGELVCPGDVTTPGVVTTGGGYGLKTDAIAKRDGTAFIAADGNINLPGASNGFAAGWLLQQINTRLNNAQARADSAYNLANGKLTQAQVDARVNALAVTNMRQGGAVSPAKANEYGPNEAPDGGYLTRAWHDSTTSYGVFFTYRIPQILINGTWRNIGRA